jgi:protein-tyrosine phosphatase
MSASGDASSFPDHAPSPDRTGGAHDRGAHDHTGGAPDRTDGPDGPGRSDGPEPSRALTFDGCVNFRDLGGYRTDDGHQTGWRRLFRADGLHRLSDLDHRQLIGLGVATVIDLRTPDEAEQRGRFPVDRVPVRYVDLPLTDVLPATEEFPSWREASYVASRYSLMVSQGAPALTGAFEVLGSDGSLPAVFHCSAGKDRTGVLSALILAFLGVPDETIVEDYALSGEAMVRLLEHLMAEYPDAAEEVQRHAPAVLQVMPETMEEFLATTRAEYGSYDDLARSLGVVEAVARIRRAVLVPV